MLSDKLEANGNETGHVINRIIEHKCRIKEIQHHHSTIFPKNAHKFVKI